MFELGEFTMAGFQNGLESMYQSTENSLKGFSINLQSDIPDYTASYRQNRNPMQFSSPSINEITADIEFSNSEQNLLLSEQNQYLWDQNQLLMQILEKDNRRPGNSQSKSARAEIYGIADTQTIG